MIILILVILLILMLSQKDDDDIIIFFALLFMAAFFAFIVLLGINISYRTIDAEIELYKTKNKEIELNISDLVSGYMEYESGTLKDLKGDSAITLISLYPDLKSDELVKQQCDLYIENNKILTELEEKKLKQTVIRWWLYFGK